MTLADADIRAPLLAALRAVPGRWVREEVPLWRSRADIVAIDDVLTALEIKSDRDTFRRFTRDGFQVDSYGRVCDRVVLVTTPRHTRQAMALTPAWWGVWIARRCIDGQAHVYEMRAPQSNPDVLPRWVAEMLYVTELRAFATELGVRRGTQNKGDLVDRVLAAAPLDAVRARVRQCWRVRDWDARRAGTAHRGETP